jgi:voltage-gated potassium channel
MGLSLLSQTVGEMVEDLMDAGAGLEIVERPITRAELGLAPADVQSEGELVLAVVRGGEVHRFDQSGVRVFQQGDRIVVIRRTEAEAPGGAPVPAPGAGSPKAPGAATPGAPRSATAPKAPRG